MTCRVCGLEHRGWVPCAKARLDAAANPPKQPAPVVVHEQQGSSQIIPVVVHTRHGQYADLDARKAYRREWMRKQRAK